MKPAFHHLEVVRDLAVLPSMMLAEQYFSAESFMACATRLGSSPLGVPEQVVTPANTQRAQAPECRRGFVQRFLWGKRENGDPR